MRLKTLLTSIDTLSSMPGDLSREGCKFLGWYENEEGKAIELQAKLL